MKACPGLRSGIDSRHSFRHSSESWNPEGVGRGETTRRWKKPARHPIFILLCGPLRSMVIPAEAGIQGEEWVPPSCHTLVCRRQPAWAVGRKECPGL